MFVLMTAIKALLLLTFVVKSRQETPQYSYECQESGDIVLHGFTDKATIQLTSVNGDNLTKVDSQCNGTYSSDKFGHILIPKVCTNKNGVQVDRIVVFRSVDSSIDGTTTTTSSTPSNASKPNTPSYGQRNHNFRIQCNKITQGVVDHVIGHIGVNNVASLPNVFNSIGTVEMRFKSEEATTEKNLEDLPDISTVYLGDKFYMYLKYIGQQEYHISPQNCTAYGDNERAVVEKDKRSKRVLLWEYKACLSPEATSLHLMKNFKKSTSKIVYAEMFGFHFDTDADITIECNVKVCATPSSDSTCTFHPDSSCSHKDWKAKRSIREEKDNRVTVKGKLHVLERQIGNSNSAGLLTFSLTSVVILQFLLFFA